MAEFNPSNCQILEASIRSHGKPKGTNINGMIGNISFTQSINMTSWMGSITVHDNSGFLENYPLRGEEELILKLNSLDLNYEIDLNAQIYKINNMSTTENNDGVVYTLHFMSKASYAAGTRRIIKSFKDQSASEIVGSLFKEYVSNYSQQKRVDEELPFSTKKYNLIGDDNRGRRLYIQPTNGYLRAIIPNYGTNQAMRFISSKSFSVNAQSSSYRFFETFEGYYFVTDEFLIKSAISNNDKVINLFYDSFVSLDPKKMSDQIRTIETLSNTKRVDVGFDTHGGGYVNKVIEIDYVRRKVNENVFDYTKDAKYIDTTGNIPKISSDIHSPEFIKDTFNEENAKRFLVFKDYSQEGDMASNLRADQYYSEIISRRTSQQHHMSSIEISIGLKGRLDISAGSIININATGFSGSNDKKPNKQISGNYLVYSVSHDINKDILKTSANLIKYDWSTT
jgi:hypothetical protein